MTEPSPITLSFLERHPEAAGAELARLDPPAAAGLLAEIPAGVAAPAMARLAPWAAAPIVDRLAPDRAAPLLRAMIISDAVPILRLLEPGLRDEIFAHLPKRVAGAFRTSLDLPLWSVGAWMDGRVINCREDQRVEDAIEAFRGQREDAGPYCCVVDDGGRYVGIAELSRLLRAGPNESLAKVADRKVPALSARGALADVAPVADWNGLNALPVLGRKRNPIGRLSGSALAKAARRGEAVRVEGDGGVFASLAGAYLDVLPALLETALPPTPPNGD